MGGRDRVTVLAGATGRLGGLIARALRDRGARVRAIVRPGTPKGTIVGRSDLKTCKTSHLITRTSRRQAKEDSSSP